MKFIALALIATVSAVDLYAPPTKYQPEQADYKANMEAAAAN